MKLTTKFERDKLIPRPWGQNRLWGKHNNGKRAVPTRALADKLGPVACGVYGMMLGLRDRHATCHPTRAGMARRLGVSVSTVGRALRRLGESGLVVGLGKFPTPHANGLRVYHWSVYGFVAGDYTCVPDEVWNWWRDNRVPPPNTHGGARAGAGRPRKEDKSREPECPSGSNSSEPPVRAALEAALSRRLRLLLRAGRAGEPARATLRVEKKPRTQKARNAMGTLRGTGLPQPDTLSRMRRLGLPMPESIPQVRVPPPPLLDPEASAEQWAHELAVAYRAAMKRVTGKKCPALSGRDITRFRLYPKLVRAAEELLSVQTRKKNPSPIAPIVWAVWSVRQWFDLVNPGNPKPGWVWDPRRICKPSNRGWCRREMDGFQLECGSIVRTVPEGQALAEKCRQLQAAVMSLPPGWADEDAFDLVDEVFPAGSWELELAAVKEATRKAQRKIDRQLLDMDPSLWGL